MSKFLLAKLAEECAEVAQRALKQMQFGKAEIQEGQELTNAQRLRDEVNDLTAVLSELMAVDELPPRLPSEFESTPAAKKAKMAKYLELSRELGLVEPALSNSARGLRWPTCDVDGIRATAAKRSASVERAEDVS